MYNSNHIMIPLMAIIEDGLQFPLHPFLREIQFNYSLALNQLLINNYRIIMTVIALKDRHDVTPCLGLAISLDLQEAG